MHLMPILMPVLIRVFYPYVPTELLVVNDKAAALQQLHDIVSNKRYRTWQPILERIMLKHVELSVEMKQARLAKDALLQFKNVCQNTNIASLDTVIRHLLALAQARVDNAQESSAARQLAAVQIADLDEGDSPETVLMRSVTGEDSKDRTDREVVAPWLRFLWETYRLALDVLRNNSKLEALYHVRTRTRERAARKAGRERAAREREGRARAGRDRGQGQAEARRMPARPNECPNRTQPNPTQPTCPNMP